MPQSGFEENNLMLAEAQYISETVEEVLKFL